MFDLVGSFANAAHKSPKRKTRRRVLPAGRGRNVFRFDCQLRCASSSDDRLMMLLDSQCGMHLSAAAPVQHRHGVDIDADRRIVESNNLGTLNNNDASVHSMMAF